MWHLLGLEHQFQFYRGQGSYKILLRHEHEPILKVSLASIPCTGLEISTWKFIQINWRKDAKFLGMTYLSHPAPVILQGSNNPRHHLKADHWSCDFQIWLWFRVQNLIIISKEFKIWQKVALVQNLIMIEKCCTWAVPSPSWELSSPVSGCPTLLHNLSIRSASPCTCVTEVFTFWSPI